MDQPNNNNNNKDNHNAPPTAPDAAEAQQNKTNNGPAETAPPSDAHAHAPPDQGEIPINTIVPIPVDDYSVCLPSISKHLLNF